MIDEQSLTELIQAHLPESRVQVHDKTGMQDHYIVVVSSTAFQGQNAMARHRMVYAAVQPALNDGRLHAIEIKTVAPEVV
ncbi:MAG: BolA/IbaG family iron-sulfur metabolism protein [Candidatus Melainabacteria bacterium]|nr:BolA/IbaG family iron-sulfur metabolism protein [Candidatus Melainabacteria bacterium]